MPFETSQPVQGPLFFDRKAELDRLLQAVQSFQNGQPSYQALLGLRKVGKSSIFKELMRRLHDEPRLFCVHLDCWGLRNPYDFFWAYVSETVNQYLIRTGHAATTGLLPRGAASSGEIAGFVGKFGALPHRSPLAALETLIALAQKQNPASVFRKAVDLPEQLADEARLNCQMILDEFQELAALSRFKDIAEHFGAVFALLRAQWQEHRSVNYFVSGSRVGLLREMLGEESAPRFQHFGMIVVSEFARRDAVKMLVALTEGSGKEIDEDLACRMYDLVGGRPYYLQCLGEETALREPGRKVTEKTFRIAVQESLLSQDGRLSLYFQNLHGQTVGGSVMNEKVLMAMASGNTRAAEIAKAVGVTVNTVGAPLKNLLRLGVIARENGAYSIVDRGYALWLQAARSTDSPVLPAFLLGTESEERVARQLGQWGFSLVYQSRASRGAFDLLAILSESQLGVQLKSCRKLPFYLTVSEKEKMIFWAKRLGWKPLLCLDVEGQIRFYELSSLRRAKNRLRIDDKTPTVENLLTLVSPQKRKEKKRR